MNSAEGKTAVTYNPLEYKDVITALGHTLIAQAENMLFEQATAVASSDNPAETVRRYIELVLSTRTKLRADPEVDNQLLIAASNAISILNYGSTLNLFAFKFSQIKDWSHTRIPYANLTMANLSGCNFDYADLSKATLFFTHAHNCSFRHAKLDEATTLESAELKVKGRNVRQAAFSPDDSALAIASESNGVELFNMKTNEWDEMLLVQQDSNIISVAYVPGGSQLAAGHDRGDISVWDLPSKAVSTTFHAHDASVQELVYTSDGPYLLSRASNGEIRIWDVDQEYKCVATIERQLAPAGAMAVSPDGKVLASITESKSVDLFKVPSGEKVATLETRRPETLAFSPDGKCLIVAGKYQPMQLWDTETLREVDRFGVARQRLVYSPDGTRVATLAPSRPSRIYVGSVISLWDPASKAYCCELLDPWVQLTHLVFSHDGLSIAAATKERGIKLYDIRAFRWLESIGQRSGQPMLRKWHPSQLRDVALANDDATLAAASGEDVYIWNIRSGDVNHIIHCNEAVGRLSFSDDGSKLVTAGGDSVQVWDMANYESVLSTNRNTEDVVSFEEARTQSVALSHDGTMLIMPDSNCMINLVNIRRNEPLRAFAGYQYGIDAVATTPDGNELFAMGLQDGGYSIFSWKEEYGDELKLLFHFDTEHRDTCVSPSFSLSPNGRYIAATGDIYVRVWDRFESKMKWILRGHEKGVTAMQFSSDGNVLVSVSRDCTFRVWDMETGKCKCRVQTRHPIYSLALSSDGSTLIFPNNLNRTLDIWKLDQASATATCVPSRIDMLGLPQRLDMRGDFSDAILSKNLERVVREHSEDATVVDLRDDVYVLRREQIDL